MAAEYLIEKEADEIWEQFDRYPDTAVNDLVENEITQGRITIEDGTRTLEAITNSYGSHLKLIDQVTIGQGDNTKVYRVFLGVTGLTIDQKHNLNAMTRRFNDFNTTYKFLDTIGAALVSVEIYNAVGQSSEGKIVQDVNLQNQVKRIGDDEAAVDDSFYDQIKGLFARNSNVGKLVTGIGGGLRLVGNLFARATGFNMVFFENNSQLIDRVPTMAASLKKKWTVEH
jgi:hypothetical protein